MIDVVALLGEIKALRADCVIVEGFDATVEKLSNISMRETAVKSLDEIFWKLNYTYRLRALTPFLEGTFLVRSMINPLGKLDQSIVEDAVLRTNTEPRGDVQKGKLDEGGTRYTYYHEFCERFLRVREKILKGELDLILGENPTLILHGISGLKGELLSSINWDPYKGETYMKVMNDPLLEPFRRSDAESAEWWTSRDAEHEKNHQRLKAMFPGSASLLDELYASTHRKPGLETGAGNPDEATRGKKAKIIKRY